MPIHNAPTTGEYYEIYCDGCDAVIDDDNQEISTCAADGCEMPVRCDSCEKFCRDCDIECEMPAVCGGCIGNGDYDCIVCGSEAPSCTSQHVFCECESHNSVSDFICEGCRYYCACTEHFPHEYSDRNISEDCMRYCHDCEEILCPSCYSYGGHHYHDGFGGEDEEMDAGDEEFNLAPVHSYGYSPEPEFYGDSEDYYMGVELELEGATFNGRYDIPEQVYIKRDSSIMGLEYVTHPMSYDYHCNQFDWAELLENLETDMSATRACGLHIHVSRYRLTRERIEHLLKQMHRIQDFLYRTSGRHMSDLQRWSNWNTGHVDSVGENLTPEQVRRAHDHQDRYVALNLKNRDTVEFRYNSATTDPDELLARISIIQALVEVALNEVEIDGEEQFVEMINPEYRDAAKKLAA